MKIGQSKLSERSGQRRELVVILIKRAYEIESWVEDFRKEESKTSELSSGLLSNTAYNGSGKKVMQGTPLFIS